MKIATVIGARPQFIKAAMLSRLFKKEPDIQEIIIHTGQHFDAAMSKVFFDELDIPKPDYNLDVAGLTHGAMTGRMLERIEKVLFEEKPDLVLVYGDTNSTLAGALAASKLHIPVAHVEAGLRSFNRQMPEEINRVLTDHVSDLLFAPTKAEVKSLLAEGIHDKKIHLVGDVTQDAAIFYADRAVKPDVAPDKPFVLATVHRAENTDDPARLDEIFKALSEISRKLSVVLPIHPRTRQKIAEADIKVPSNSALHLVNPVGYLEMIWLLKHCKLVMTDSGGLQKEAYFFKKPCIILRDGTEWVELVKAGVNVLAGTSTQTILSAFEQIIVNQLKFTPGLYGSGKASEKIMRYIKGYIA